MSNRKRAIMWTLLAIGGVLVLLSMPCFFLGFMGLLGIAADVGPAENRQMGWQFLGVGAIPFVVGSVLLIVAYVMRRR